MNIQEIFLMIRKRILLVLSLTLFCGSFAAVISFFYFTPIYEAETQLLINQKQSEDYYVWAQQMEADIRLIDTYSVIMNSPAILDKVMEQLDLDISSETLSKKISVESKGSSKVVTISVIDENPTLAAQIANTLANTFQEEVLLLMNVDNINILSKAKEEVTPIKPNKLINIVLGVLLGMLLGVCLVILFELLDSTIKSEQDVEEILELPVMGIVSSFTLEEKIKGRKNG